MKRAPLLVLSFLLALSACSAPKPGVVTPAGGLRLTLPTTPVRLDISEPWFRVGEAHEGDGVAYVLAENDPTAQVISANLEPARASDCRDYYWTNAQRDSLERTDVEMSEYDRFALVSYTVPEVMGMPVNQRNVIACAEVGGVFGVIHLSKAGFKPEEQLILESTLASANMYRGSLDDTAAPRHYPVPAHGFISLTLPAAWRTWMRLPALDLPPTISIVPSDGNDWEILVTPLWSKLGDDQLPPPFVQDQVEKIRAKVAGEGEETEARIHPWQTAETYGAYFASSYPQPKPTQFKYLTRGWAKAGDLILVFTISSHTPTAPIFEQALEIMRRARQDAKPS